MKSAEIASYGTIVVIGGGCYGSYYVRQLGRASSAGVLSWDRVLVVDRNSECLLSSNGELEKSGGASPAPTLITADWLEFFRDYLGSWQRDQNSKPTDSIVPSPLMPHLLYDWVRDRAIDRWPDRSVETVPLGGTPDTPWQSAAPDGTHYASFATWTCPVNCIEPEICPHTRSDRTWTMPKAMEDYVASEMSRGSNISGPLVFHCTHRTFGVGMIPVASVIDADAFIARSADVLPSRFVVATVSHCHGAINVLAVS